MALKQAKLTVPQNASISPTIPSRRWFVGIILVGLAVRVAMVALSPRYGYYQDHDDLARWGLQAVEEGVLTLYDHPPKPAQIRFWEDGKYEIGLRPMDRLCNYPPLCAYLLGASGHVFHAISSERLINTPASRWSIALWGLPFDLLLAWGCASLAAWHGRGFGWPCLAAFALGFLSPPFWLVSTLWGQVDTWVLAPAVWMVWAMVSGKWGWAGLLLGVTAALKPQAAAFIPVWGLAIFIVRPVWKPLLGLAAAAAALVVIALPFSLHSGLAWWRQSYQENLFEHSKGMTTLMAFNVWYLDVLVSGSVDETARWLGLTKATWGQAGLLTALIVGFVFMLRRWGGHRGGYVMWTVLVTLAFVMIPTRVHDRFIVLILPFLIVAGVIWRRMIPGLVLLLMVATAQTSWPQWLNASSADWEQFVKDQTQAYQSRLDAMPPDQRASQPSPQEYLRPYHEEFLARNRPIRPFEWLFSILGVAGALGVAVAAARTRPRAGEPA